MEAEFKTTGCLARSSFVTVSSGSAQAGSGTRTTGQEWGTHWLRSDPIDSLSGLGRLFPLRRLIGDHRNPSRWSPAVPANPFLPGPTRCAQTHPSWQGRGSGIHLSRPAEGPGGTGDSRPRPAHRHPSPLPRRGRHKERGKGKLEFSYLLTPLDLLLIIQSPTCNQSTQ